MIILNSGHFEGYFIHGKTEGYGIDINKDETRYEVEWKYNKASPITLVCFEYLFWIY